MYKTFVSLSIVVTVAGCGGTLSEEEEEQETVIPESLGCGGDPTTGFTEYSDKFKVQHPYNLDVSDRFSFSDGVYSTWIHHNDLPFKPGSKTGPRTEMRWLQNWNSGERMWEADVLVDAPTSHSAIMQVKSDDSGAHEAIYLQVKNGQLEHGGGPVIAHDVVGHWFHLNVAYNTATRTARVWKDNCLIFTRKHPVAATWYFKNGIYNCDPAQCRSHFKNIRFWRR